MSQVNRPAIESLNPIHGIFGIRLGDQPSYEVVSYDKVVEIRYYDPQTLATITINENEDEEEAFLSLARYVHGHNSSGRSLAESSPVSKDETMTSYFTTAPLLHSKENNQLTLSLVLPHEFSVSSAPSPIDSRIFIVEKPSHLKAAIKFSSPNFEENIEYQQILKEWIHNHQLYTPLGHILTAQYDGPDDRKSYKRHEVQLEIVERQ